MQNDGEIPMKNKPQQSTGFSLCDSMFFPPDLGFPSYLDGKNETINEKSDGFLLKCTKVCSPQESIFLTHTPKNNLAKIHSEVST